MKKIVALMFAALVSGMMASAQIAEGVKLLNYEKNKTARALFQKSYDANPKDPQSIYWLGQAILAGDGVTPAAQKIAAAKALYQKGLQDIGSDPLLVVGMGHIEVLEGGDLNSAKQKFEQAITATTETKGKNKGKVSPLILNAIGRANADGGSKVGDPVYAIEKLKLAKAYDPANTDPNIPDIFINMGINYLKLGGENGGEAVKAYEEAIAKDPKNALAYYRIGKIYLSQNNKEIFDQYFDKAIQADPTFPQVYYSLFDYYANRDVNKAKEYLDKYIANAEKDPKNDLYLAEYLFRAGRYQESLDKLKELDNTVGIKALPGLGLIYAYDYDRLGDSVSAKKYIQDYIDNTPTEKLRLPDYELALKIVAKFPGNEAVASGYVEKALVLDTVKKNQIDFMDQAAAIFGKAKIYPEQLKWMKRKLELKGALSEADHYSLTNAAMNAKEYAIGLEFARNYLNAYPDKPQPANFFRRAAIALDPDSTKGTAIEHLAYLNTILEKDLEKNKTAVFRNNYYTLVFYVNKFNNLKKSPDFKVKSDGTKTEVVDQFLATCQKAVEVTDKMIALFPDATSDENKFATEQKNSILKNIDYYSKPPAKQPAGGGKGNGTPSPKK
ncbi:MAG: tetratricopeptide repeat protein [Sediminibacterium sp.]